MLNRFLTAARTIVTIIAVPTAFVFLAELLRLFAFFHRIHPVLGWAFAATLAVTVLFSILCAIRVLRAHPRVLEAPPRPEVPGAGYPALHRYGRYLARYLERLARNPNLHQEARDRAAAAVENIEETMRAHPLTDDLARLIEQTERNEIGAILAGLNDAASAEVRHCVRDVMLGVTLSPYASVDAFIVIYRNAAMVLRIVRLYRSRPGAREQWLILRDVLLVVATVNFLNVSRRLIESLFSQIPLVGRAVDDIGQGLGAGLLTSVTGHAAIRRCAAFTRWDREAEARSVGAEMSRFLADVRDLFTRDLAGELRGRIRAMAPPEAAEAPGFWESVLRGIGSAVDMTARMLDTVVIKPAAAGAQTVASAGAGITRGVMRAGSSVARVSAHHGRAASRGVFRVIRTFGQRLRYTVFGSYGGR